MGFIRGIFRFVVAVLIIAVGVLFFMYEKEEINAFADNLYVQFVEQAPEIPLENVTYRQILAGGITFVGLVLAWFVLVPKRRPRSVTFAGTHGEVTIELEPVEATLERVAMKLPEVKNISIQLKPLEGNGRIQILAIAILAKNADDDARMVTARVHNFLQIHTRKIVGLQDVDAKLTVKKFIMNMKTVKPEPLLLEAPDAASTQSTHTPAAPVVVAPAPVATQDTSLEALDSAELDRGTSGESNIRKY